MADEGWIVVARALLDTRHDLHPQATGSPACELGAWVDLIGYARWKDTGGLKRGQCRASEVFLAARWNWSRSRVHRFLVSLEEANRIERLEQPGARQANIISICNYDTYQDPRTTGEQPAKGERYNERTTNDTQEEPEQERRKKNQTTAAARVGEFCERTGSEWRLDKGIQEWVEEIQGEPKYAGADIPYEINKCTDWHVNKGRTPKAPDISIRNWLERSAKRAREEASTNGDGPPPWLAGLEAEDGWGNE